MNNDFVNALQYLDNKSIADILKKAGYKITLYALKNASYETKEKFLANAKGFFRKKLAFYRLKNNLVSDNKVHDFQKTLFLVIDDMIDQNEIREENIECNKKICFKVLQEQYQSKLIKEKADLSKYKVDYDKDHEDPWFSSLVAVQRRQVIHLISKINYLERKIHSI